MTLISGLNSLAAGCAIALLAPSGAYTSAFGAAATLQIIAAIIIFYGGHAKKIKRRIGDQ
jgi:hypothetical protein